jgi:hypothetical protein
MPTRPLALGLVALLCCGAVSVGLLSCLRNSTPVGSLIRWDGAGALGTGALAVGRAPLVLSHPWLRWRYEWGVPRPGDGGFPVSRALRVVRCNFS